MASYENQKNKALLLGTITYAIGNFGTKILSFLIVPLYTYYITPADLGDYDLLITTVNLLSPLLTMKLSDATYRWIINDPENRNMSISATYQLLIRNCILFSLLLAVVNHFIPIWHCGYFIAILVTNRMMECVQKLLRGVKNQKLFAASGIFYTGLLVSLNLIQICIFGQGVVSLLQSTLISQIVTIILILAFDKRLRVYRKFENQKELQKEMLRYSIPLVPSALAWWAMSASDRYVIRWVIGNSANGIYSVACKFPTILQTVFTMFNNAWTDLILAELKGKSETEKYISNTFEKLYKTSFGLTLFLIPTSKVVMQLILSEAYKNASVYVGFLYLGTVFQGFSSFYSVGYLQGKQTKGAAITSIYGAAINVIVDLLFIKYIGLYAAAISTFLGFFVMWLTRMHDTREDLPIDINKKIFISLFIACIMMAYVSTWTMLFVDSILMILTGALFLWLSRDIIITILGKGLKKIKRHE